MSGTKLRVCWYQVSSTLPPDATPQSFDQDLSQLCEVYLVPNVRYWRSMWYVCGTVCGTAEAV
eukprot:2572222-Rhodomonas_salina.3